MSAIDGLPPLREVIAAAEAELAGRGRLLIRPSGTEPKLKVYLDVRGDSADDAAARRCPRRVSVS